LLFLLNVNLHPTTTCNTPSLLSTQTDTRNAIGSAHLPEPEARVKVGFFADAKRREEFSTKGISTAPTPDIGSRQPLSKADRTQVNDQPTLSTDMELDKLASKIQDIQMRDADDPPASKHSSNKVSDELTDKLTKASSTKLVNKRGKTGSPPDKRSRADSVSLVSPPNDKEDATTTLSEPKETPSGPTYAKAVVGFRTHDEVRAESAGPDGEGKLVTTKSLDRKHTLFIKIMFLTTASKSDPIKTAQAQLMDYISMLQEIDETALLY
jgi:hypothetical protein